jgi:hypothetical protein
MTVSKHDNRSFIEVDFGIVFYFDEVNISITLIAALLI